jgi:hypothetical protein
VCTITVLSLAFGCAGSTGETGRGDKDYTDTVCRAGSAIPEALEMDDLFTTVDHFVSVDNSNATTGTWNSP